jgi:uncharacterized membrane protein
MITAAWSRNRLLHTIVVLYLIYVAAFWLTNVGLYFSKMGLTYASVTEYYLGSEERFLSARSYQGLLELSHFHLFAMGMLLLVLTHLTLFIRVSNRTKLWLIVVPFLSALIDEGSGWLVRFVHPLFAYGKIAGFLLLQSSLAVLVVVSLWAVFASPPDEEDFGDEDELRP